PGWRNSYHGDIIRSVTSGYTLHTNPKKLGRPTMAQAIHRLCGAMAAVFGVTSLIATPALAQQPGAREKVEVTGSNIKRIEGETALPVTIFTRSDIERMGATDTEDILKRITSNTAGYSETTQGVGYAVSNANLRGLGASSTLVLLNGRRLAN